MDAPSRTIPRNSADAVIDLRGGDPVVSDERPRLAFVDLAADYEAHRVEIDAAIGGVLERCDFILGEATAQFEQEFASYCHVDLAVGTDSGFSALELMLRAYEIGPGDEVITAANTFYSTVRPIETCGATPVLVDADPDTRTIDPSLIERAITANTRAIIAVHLYGHPADMDTVNDIAAGHGLLVFEDACQAHGAEYRGRRVGSLGHAAAFSFYPSKNLGAFGDAGIVTTNRPDIAERIRSLRNLGSLSKNHHEGDGFNRRLDTLQAAVLSVKLRHLDTANTARRQVADWYAHLLDATPLRLPSTADWACPVHHLFVVESPRRDSLATTLDHHGIPTGIHYPTPIHLIPSFASLGHGRGDFPVAEELSDTILSLPMHPYLSAADVADVAASIGSALDR